MRQTQQRAVGKRLALFTLAGLVWRSALALSRRKPVDLRDKVVVITGSSRGLGLALAEECARQGARIVLCARDGQHLRDGTATYQRPRRSDARGALRCHRSVPGGAYAGNSAGRVRWLLIYSSITPRY